MRPSLRAGAVAAILAGIAGPSSARIVLVQTASGPVWTNVPEPAGNRLPSPSARRLPWQGLIGECAGRHGVDSRLVEAVIACESNFDPQAVSSAGAEGLMQLMPETQGIYGVEDPFDAAQNVEAGTRHLGDLLESFGGDWKLAVAAYNAGAGAVRRSGGIPPYPETMHYVRKVQHYLGELGVDLHGASTDVAMAGLGGVSLTGEAAPDPVLDWQPEPEPPPELEPPKRRGPAPVIVRDASGRVTFTNRGTAKAAPAQETRR